MLWRAWYRSKADVQRETATAAKGAYSPIVSNRNSNTERVAVATSLPHEREEVGEEEEEVGRERVCSVARTTVAETKQ